MNNNFISLNGDKALITYIEYLPIRNQIVSASDDCCLRVWNIFNLKSDQILKQHNRGIIYIIDLPKKRIFITAGKDKAIGVWSYISKNIVCIRFFPLIHESIVLCLKYSEKHNFLISSGQEKKIKCINI